MRHKKFTNFGRFVVLTKGPSILSLINPLCWSEEIKLIRPREQIVTRDLRHMYYKF